MVGSISGPSLWIPLVLIVVIVGATAFYIARTQRATEVDLTDPVMVQLAALNKQVRTIRHVCIFFFLAALLSMLFGLWAWIQVANNATTPNNLPTCVTAVGGC
jgi:hypothetical protein